MMYNQQVISAHWAATQLTLILLSEVPLPSVITDQIWAFITKTKAKITFERRWLWRSHRTPLRNFSSLWWADSHHTKCLFTDRLILFFVCWNFFYASMLQILFVYDRYFLRLVFPSRVVCTLGILWCCKLLAVPGIILWHNVGGFSFLHCWSLSLKDTLDL